MELTKLVCGPGFESKYGEPILFCHAVTLKDIILFVFRSCLVPVSYQTLTTIMKGLYVSPQFLKAKDVAVSTGSGKET
jgi:hypothetical protein